MYYPGYIIKARHKHIQSIAKACGSIPYAMCQVKPAVSGFNGCRAKAHFHFKNSMVHPLVNYHLFVDYCISNIFG